MNKPYEYYNKNINNIKKNLEDINKIINIFSGIRLGIVIITLILAYYFFVNDNVEAFIINLSCGTFIFICIAILHNGKINKKNIELKKLEYNERGIKRLNGEWRSFKDNGAEFLEKNHNFSADLDIFGDSSLFQWINTTKTKFGREKLAKILRVNKLPEKYDIYDSQEAIKELVNKREFCEKIYIETARKNKKKANGDEVVKWSKEKETINKTIKYIPYFFIIITTIMIFLVITKRLSISYLILNLIINYLVVKLLTRQLSNVIDIFVENKYEIRFYSKILSLIEYEEFNSKKITAIQKKLRNGGKSCSKELSRLNNIVNWIGDSVGNAYYFIINTVIMSDVFILYNLQKWRIENGQYLEEWIEVMGEIEALCSLSNIAFENPQWSYPKISLDKEIQAKKLGHPLLGSSASVNSFGFKNEEKVALITGSNMSGKSTFLRTVGFNMILSYIGAPTFSEGFRCGIFNIFTCMRTQDNLEENTSSFYAEILRIKLVIAAAKKGEQIFFLLDEIFKGTNSNDRHEGATILIEQLVKANAMGLVSTHDFELCDLENSKKWLVNYNFREYYEENNIKFDYILRKGRSETRNAKHLMRLAGIDIDEK